MPQEAWEGRREEGQEPGVFSAGEAVSQSWTPTPRSGRYPI